MKVSHSPQLLLFTVVAATYRFCVADIVFENELFIPAEIFDFVYSTDSDVWWQTPNTTKYFCVYRNLWEKEFHPKKYPKLARVSTPLMYSSTKQYHPWLKNRQTTYGVQNYVKYGSSDTLKNEVTSTGELILDYEETKGFSIDQEKGSDDNFQYMPGVKVNPQFPYLTGMASMNPSPDWFTGFYLFYVLDEYDRTYWDHFIIKTYPWDAGVEDGTTYKAVSAPKNPKGDVVRITDDNSPNGIFVSREGDVKPVGEWDCILHVCDVGDDDCQPEDWPPANGCDRLRYPGCEKLCDPAVEKCQECIPKMGDPEQVFYQSCCESDYEPKDGHCKTRDTIAGGHYGATKTGGKDTKSAAGATTSVIAQAIVMLSWTVVAMLQ